MIMTLNRTITRINEQSFRVVDNGMEYEIVTFDLINSDYNIANGGKPILYGGREVFKIKKDGSRGKKLSWSGTRKWEVAR